MPSSTESAGTGPTLDKVSPITSSGSATTRPAIGPATPTSNNASGSAMGRRILMTAPRVPSDTCGGSGMKYGRLTATPCRRAIR